MDLEERIQRLEDIEAIRHLKARYFHACDQKDIEKIRACFADGDILIDYGVIGVFQNRETFLNVFEEKACFSHIIDLHHGQNAQIDWQSPTAASAIWDLFFYQINTEQSTVTQLGGSYYDRFEKRDGQWQIVETVFKVTSSHVSKTAEGHPQVLYAGGPPA